MKKRRIVLILAAACTLSLIGCNGSYGGNMDQTSKTQGTQSPETGTEPQSAADTESDLETNSAVGTESDSEKNAPSGTEQSFIGTVIAESTMWMIVEPAKTENERSLSDRITIQYPTDHYDYLYGEGRRVVIYYNDAFLTDSPSGPCITTEDISTEGFRDFELSVEPSGQAKKALILSSDEIAGFSSFPEANTASLYYCGLSEVWITVDGQTSSLKDAVRDGWITLNGIIQKANSQVQDGILEELYYDDGGTAVYRYPDYTIIKYHTLDGNRDVYIMSPDVDAGRPRSRCLAGSQRGFSLYSRPVSLCKRQLSENAYHCLWSCRIFPLWCYALRSPGGGSALRKARRQSFSFRKGDAACPKSA